MNVKGGNSLLLSLEYTSFCKIIVYLIFILLLSMWFDQWHFRILTIVQIGNFWFVTYSAVCPLMLHFQLLADFELRVIGSPEILHRIVPLIYVRFFKAPTCRWKILNNTNPGMPKSNQNDVSIWILPPNRGQPAGSALIF